jgi:hypothetical protein
MQQEFCEGCCIRSFVSTAARSFLSAGAAMSFVSTDAARSFVSAG